MVSTALTSVEEYLGTVYDPDRDYVEGQLLDRNVGEVDHSDAQSSSALFLRKNYADDWVGVAARMQVRRDRFRVPDVMLVKGGKPRQRIVTQPPELVVEVLSPDDRAADLQDRIDDYLAFGIGAVWVINPANGRGFVYTREGMEEPKDRVLRSVDGVIQMPLSAIFPGA